jgi:nitrate reductase gamma subunit
MTNAVPAVDLLLFLVLPYAAVVLLIVATAERYRKHAYSCSSHSTQFLENRQHFWGIVPFHYGLIAVLLGHLLIFALPGQVIAWNAEPLRLYLLEIAGLMFGLLAAIGLLLVVARRIAHPKLRAVTRRLDWVVYAVLGIQVITGVQIAIVHAWGSGWFAAAAAPYLWSLVLLRPDLTFVATLPLAIKAHIAGAFVLIAILPFSRLVHVFDVPNAYLWRRPQVVRWHRVRPLSGDRS